MSRNLFLAGRGWWGLWSLCARREKNLTTNTALQPARRRGGEIQSGGVSEWQTHHGRRGMSSRNCLLGRRFVMGLLAGRRGWRRLGVVGGGVWQPKSACGLWKISVTCDGNELARERACCCLLASFLNLIRPFLQPKCRLQTCGLCVSEAATPQGPSWAHMPPNHMQHDWELGSVPVDTYRS